MRILTLLVIVIRNLTHDTLVPVLVQVAPQLLGAVCEIAQVPVTALASSHHALAHDCIAGQGASGKPPGSNPRKRISAPVLYLISFASSISGALDGAPNDAIGESTCARLGKPGWRSD